MPLSRTSLGTFSTSGGGTGGFTTSAFTPPASSLLVVVGGFLEYTGTTDPSGDMAMTALKDSDGTSAGLSWTKAVAVGDPNFYSSGLAIWHAPIGAAIALDLQATQNGRTQDKWFLAAYALTGYDIAQPAGASPPSNAALATDGAISLTLPTAPVVESEVFGALFCKLPASSWGDPVAGTGFTERALIDDNSAYGMLLEVQSRTGSISSSVAWQDASNGANAHFGVIGVALEIRAAIPPVWPQYTHRVNTLLRM